MLVKELKEMLDGISGDFEVVMSTDEEGNHFKRVHGFSPRYIKAFYANGFHIIESCDTAERVDYENCIVFWPNG